MGTREILDTINGLVSEYSEKVINNKESVERPLFEHVPEFGTISTLEDIKLALKQRIYCGECVQCYWNNHCAVYHFLLEMLRVVALLDDSARKPRKQGNHVTCKQCVYATSTKPRICMCKESIAKHGYVRDDSYCDKGELCES